MLWLKQEGEGDFVLLELTEMRFEVKESKLFCVCGDTVALSEVSSGEWHFIAISHNSLGELIVPFSLSFRHWLMISLLKQP